MHYIVLQGLYFCFLCKLPRAKELFSLVALNCTVGGPSVGDQSEKEERRRRGHTIRKMHELRKEPAEK